MKLQVLNPVARKVEKKQSSLASRPSNLDGKVIGLYWNQKPGGDIALRRAGELLKGRFERLATETCVGSIGANLRFVNKADVMRMAQEYAGVIGSTAD